MHDIVQRFDALRTNCAPREIRTDEASVKKVNAHFGIQLPELLVQLAVHSKNYYSYFLSIGDDYQSLDHIIRDNSYWRRRRPKRRLPRNLIILTIGHMDDMFWCLDTSAPTDNPHDAYAVQFWCPEEITYCENDRPILRYPNFEQYMEGVIKWW